MMKGTSSVTELKGIGKKKADILASYGIFDIRDIVERFPRKYEDRRNITPVSELVPDKDQLVRAKVVSRRYSGFRYKKKSPLMLLVEDDTGRMEVVFFNGAYIANLFNVGKVYTFFGRVTSNRGALQMIHPEFHRDGDPDDIRGLIPVYPQISGISQNEFRKLVRQAMDLISDEAEWLPEGIVKDYKLADPMFTLTNIHFPVDEKKILQARFRLVFEELLTLELGMMLIKGDASRTKKGVVIDTKGASDLIEKLPFELTDGQKKAWEEISADLESDRPMNRLVQGDVGSGKTVVCELCMYSAFRSGYQSVLMAPTEILAKQHFEKISKDMEGLGPRVALLTGDVKPSVRKEILALLEEGKIDMLIGTHALIEPGVKFKSLGVAVTDEQHRFGVEQRHLLSDKGEGINIMVTTATPIPRTLAVVVYGDLDISQIRDMPEGRKKIITKVAHPEDRMRLYDFVKKKVNEGDQAYIVAPIIEESDKIEARSAEELFKEAKDIFKGKNIALLHGGMPPEEKDRIMADFAAGIIDVIVATVVIEIGIDVANATIMVIENSERFGLAQMHQLRGRVGRGNKQSYCFLVMNSETEIASERASIMEKTSDGFVISEEDLRLRGPGEIFGTRQHGLPELKISDLLSHADVLEKAKRAASDILEKDPSVKNEENRMLKERVKKMFGEDIELVL